MPEEHVGAIDLLSCLKALLLWLLLALLSGCGSISYVWDAARGHITVLAQAQDIDSLLLQENLEPRLRAQLELVKDIRRYSVDKLAMPENRAYSQYTDLGRRFVVWNVVASRDDSFELKRWCFALFGCVSYKGFFDEASAKELASALSEEGWDTVVVGVPAYSTLGLTADPVLNTFVYLPPGELARLLFHELAHQVVYISDDTRFNESFATAVEELGVQAWLDRLGDDAFIEQYRSFNAKREQFTDLLGQAKTDLEVVYDDPTLSRAEKLQRKQERLNALSQDYRQVRDLEWAGWNDFEPYFQGGVNNARLALVGLYNQEVPSFKTLFARCGSDFPSFYNAVKALGRLDAPQRADFLQRLAQRQPLPYGLGCDQSMYPPRSSGRYE
ncbi:MAG: aminopeptidase [Limnobacter sp.]|nr:aminopeptidase [Limnobacter sp.]